MTPPPKQSDRAYKRSWKNLLLNKRYQLRFTLFMVGLSSALMIGLGVWVMKVANETTEVSMTSVRGTPCPKIPVLAGAKGGLEPLPYVPMKLDEEPAANKPAPDDTAAPDDTTAPDDPAAPDDTAAPDDPAAPDDSAAPTGVAEESAAGGADPAAAGSADPAGAATGEEAPRRITVQIDESSMTMVPVIPKVPADLGTKIVAHWTCELRLDGKIDQLERGRLRILWVLIGTGLILVFGLAIYGIKMTHKVAGPLFKVGLYLNKMRSGKFDKVYNLRKGDQLVDFYEHFKTAHAGIVKMQADDIQHLKAVIAAAEAAGAGEHATVVSLREVLARKEKSLE